MSIQDIILKSLGEEVDRDGDGRIFDGTNKERPAPQSPNNQQPQKPTTQEPEVSAATLRQRLRSIDERIQAVRDKPYKGPQDREDLERLAKIREDMVTNIEEFHNTHSEFDVDLAEAYGHGTYLDDFLKHSYDLEDIERMVDSDVAGAIDKELEDEWVHYIDYATEYNDVYKEAFTGHIAEKLGVNRNEAIAQMEQATKTAYKDMLPTKAHAAATMTVGQSSELMEILEEYTDGIESKAKETEEYQRLVMNTEEELRHHNKMRYLPRIDEDSGGISASQEVRAELKQKIVEDVANRIEKKLGFGRGQDIDKATNTMFDGPIRDFTYPEYLVKHALNAWADSSTSTGSLMMQEAVRRRYGNKFGMDRDIIYHNQGYYEDAMKAMQDKGVAEVMDALVTSIYENTQDRLAKSEDTHITVFRGMRWHEPPEEVKSIMDGDGMSASMYGKEVKATLVSPEQNPISSFTIDAATAESFAAAGDTEAAAISVAIVPNERVFSTFETGPGCLVEAEFTLLGGDPLNAITIVGDSRGIPENREELYSLIRELVDV